MEYNPNALRPSDASKDLNTKKSEALDYASQVAVCRLAVCESALWDINQAIPYDCKIDSSNGASAEHIFFGIMYELGSIRELLEAATA